MKTYVYDKRIGKVVEKRSRDSIALLPMPGPPQWWRDYLDLLADCRDIIDGLEPTRFLASDKRFGDPTQ